MFFSCEQKKSVLLSAFVFYMHFSICSDLITGATSCNQGDHKARLESSCDVLRPERDCCAWYVHLCRADLMSDLQWLPKWVFYLLCSVRVAFEHL